MATFENPLESSPLKSLTHVLYTGTLDKKSSSSWVGFRPRIGAVVASGAFLLYKEHGDAAPKKVIALRGAVAHPDATPPAHAFAVKTAEGAPSTISRRSRAPGGTSGLRR
jgi:hypothetical protein